MATYSDSTKAVIDTALDSLKSTFSPVTLAALRLLVERDKLDDTTLVVMALEHPEDVLVRDADANH